jgi:uncharacterized protein YwgA
MNRHQLATLLSWAGEQGFSGRKRLQKVVFFLQQAGCDLGCHYTLHHFGPYSQDVADACDEMVAAGLVIETGGPQSTTKQYSYTLKPEIRDSVSTTPESQIQQFQTLGKELIETDLWQLELGSIILFFRFQAESVSYQTRLTCVRRQKSDWNQALEEACNFRKVSPTVDASQSALNLAKRFQAEYVS